MNNITKCDINVGDILVINGINDENTNEDWFAVVVKNDINNIYVSYLTKKETLFENKEVYMFDDDFNTIEINMIKEHLSLKIRKSLLYYGFVRKTESIYVKYDKTPVEDDEVSIEYLSSNNSSDESDNSDDTEGSLRDFIVKDEEGELFCEAENNNVFVNETHDINKKYAEWVPKNDTECKVKITIDKIEEKAKHMDDNVRFLKK